MHAKVTLSKISPIKEIIIIIESYFTDFKNSYHDF